MAPGSNNLATPYRKHKEWPLRLYALPFNALPQVFLYSATLVILYNVLHAVYNVTLHPLANVPGYKLAGMTKLYQAFWSFKDGRSVYFRKVDEMHKTFGPIVRIQPNEVSLRDPEDFDKIYNVRTRFTKDPAFYGTMGVNHGMFGELDNEKHRKLRAPWNTFFSKAAVAKIDGLIKEKIDLLGREADMDLEKTGKIPIQALIHAMMVDIVSAYTLPECLNMLQQRDVAYVYVTELFYKTRFIWIMMISPWVCTLLQSVSGFFSRLQLPVTEFDQLFRHCTSVVDAYYGVSDPQKAGGRSKSVIEMMAEPSKLKDTKISRAVMIDEAYSFNLASAFNFGTITSVTLYYLLQHKEMYDRVRSELTTAFPGDTSDASCAKAKDLPYLSACVKEGFRLGYGPIGRLPRVVPEPGASFHGHHLPAGTVVGVWSFVQHHNPDVFGEDHEMFNPDRWLDPERAAYMSKYLVSFGKDGRQCIGKELSLSTMFLFLSTIIRRYPRLEVVGDYPIDDLRDHFGTSLPHSAERLTVRPK